MCSLVEREAETVTGVLRRPCEVSVEANKSKGKSKSAEEMLKAGKTQDGGSGREVEVVAFGVSGMKEAALGCCPACELLSECGLRFPDERHTGRLSRGLGQRGRV